jgi:hypothetical protein
MSEGDTFLHKAIYDISLLIRDPTASPVQGAEDLIRRFCTKELRGVEGGVEGVEDYVANAVVDLVLMSTWSIAATQLGVDNLPVRIPLLTCYSLTGLDVHIRKRLEDVPDVTRSTTGERGRDAESQSEDTGIIEEDG